YAWPPVYGVKIQIPHAQLKQCDWWIALWCDFRIFLNTTCSETLGQGGEQSRLFQLSRTSSPFLWGRF
ncbi:MAG: hypothetical protein ACPGD7_16315, partial [bacterium]